MVEYSPIWESGYLWAVIVGFIVAFIVAFGMGANDCANSYGTVVGSGVLKLWQAYILATVFEMLGAVLLGYKVTETLRKSIVDVDIYNVSSAPNENFTAWVLLPNSTECDETPNCTTYTSADFIVGEVGALTGTAFWLILATIFHLPVSTTHSAVGATVGFSLVLRGSEGINWMTIVNIAVSWVVSPALAGAIAIGFYLIIKYTCLSRDDQFESSLKMLPCFYWFTLVINIFSVLFDGSKYLKFDILPWWVCLLISLAIGSSVAGFMFLWGVSMVRKRVLKKQGASEKDKQLTVDTRIKTIEELSVINLEILSARVDKDFTTMDSSSPVMVQDSDSGKASMCTERSTITANTNTPTTMSIGVSNASTPALSRPKLVMVSVYSMKEKLISLKRPVEEHPLAAEVFTYLQTMSACFLSFGHGSNDTSNAVGPLVGLWVAYKTGHASNDNEALEYMTLFGAGSMIIGLWVLGHNVIKMVGTEIVKVTPPSGFAMEIGTAFTVLLASKVGIPISTTHCAIGAVVAVGWVKSHEGGVSWTTFRNIGISWVVTLPVAGAVSALLTFLLSTFVVKA